MTTRYACFGVMVMTDGTRTPQYITQANVDDLVAALVAAFPSVHITWHLDNGALDDSTGSWGWLRTYIAGRIASHGDAVSYWRTFGFPGTNAATEASLVDTYLPVAHALGGPPLISGWYVPRETLSYARTTYAVKTAVGQVWSQHGVDGFSGDGSVNCAYYPSALHSLVPAQLTSNRIDTVVLDALNQDVFAAASGSRVTIDPADAGTLTRMQQITQSYYDDAWSPGLIRKIHQHVQIDYLYTPANSAVLSRLKSYWTWLAANYTVSPVTIEEYGTAWRAAHPTNDFAIAHGQTDPVASGDAIYWLHTASHRVAVKRTNAGVVTLLDLVRYSDATTAPAVPSLSVEPPAKISQRDATHPTNLYTLAAYRELAGLFATFPALNSQLRAAA